MELEIDNFGYGPFGLLKPHKAELRGYQFMDLDGASDSEKKIILGILFKNEGQDALIVGHQGEAEDKDKEKNQNTVDAQPNAQIQSATDEDAPDGANNVALNLGGNGGASDGAPKQTPVRHFSDESLQSADIDGGSGGGSSGYRDDPEEECESGASGEPLETDNIFCYNDQPKPEGLVKMHQSNSYSYYSVSAPALQYGMSPFYSEFSQTQQYSPVVNGGYPNSAPSAFYYPDPYAAQLPNPNIGLPMSPTAVQAQTPFTYYGHVHSFPAQPVYEQTQTGSLAHFSTLPVPNNGPSFGGYSGFTYGGNSGNQVQVMPYFDGCASGPSSPSYFQGTDLANAVQLSGRAQRRRRNSSGKRNQRNRNRNNSYNGQEDPDAYCHFCWKNGETWGVYRSHVLRNANGILTCPILMKYVCPKCGQTGLDAHTERFCPARDKSDDKYRHPPKKGVLASVGINPARYLRLAALSAATRKGEET